MAVGGAQSRCPLCGASLFTADCSPLDERQCPRCGAKLWVISFSDGPTCFVRRPGETKYELLASFAGSDGVLNPSDIEAAIKKMDSLDFVEFLLELEENSAIR